MEKQNKYQLGSIGVGGHWFRRIYYSMKKDGRMEPGKGVGVSPYRNRSHLQSFGITQDKYYQIEFDEEGKPTAKIPQQFFEGLDVIHIASWNQYHSEQTKQSLENDLITVTEKTLATTQEQFIDTIDFIKEGGYSKKVAVNLHYLGKSATRALMKDDPKLLLKALKKYGRINRVEATFFEDLNTEDERRTWLYKKENGGIWMDWGPHPSAILVNQCGAIFQECVNAELFIVRPEYHPVYPTGILADFKIQGENFSTNSIASIRVAKGLAAGVTTKKIRFYFEKDAYLEVQYSGTEAEYEYQLMGNISLVEGIADERKIVEIWQPTERMPREIFIEEIVKMIEGGDPPQSLDEIQEIYKPQWLLNDLVDKPIPKGDIKDVREFIRKGMLNF